MTHRSCRHQLSSPAPRALNHFTFLKKYFVPLQTDPGLFVFYELFTEEKDLSRYPSALGKRRGAACRRGSAAQLAHAPSLSAAAPILPGDAGANPTSRRASPLSCFGGAEADVETSCLQRCVQPRPRVTFVQALYCTRIVPCDASRVPAPCPGLLVRGVPCCTRVLALCPKRGVGRMQPTPFAPR